MDYTLRLQRDILHTLALLLFSPEEPRLAASRQLKDADREYVEAFTWLASAHHVVVRAVESALDDAVRHHEEPAAWVTELRRRELSARPGRSSGSSICGDHSSREIVAAPTIGSSACGRRMRSRRRSRLTATAANENAAR